MDRDAPETQQARQVAYKSTPFDYLLWLVLAMLSVVLLSGSLPPRELGDWCRLLVLPGLFWAWSVRNRPTANQSVAPWITGFYVYLIAENGGKLLDATGTHQPTNWLNAVVLLVACIGIGYAFIPLRRK